MKSFKTIMLSFTAIAFFAQNSIALDHQAAFSEDKDAFMELVFFKEAKGAKKKGWKSVESNFKLAAATGACIAGIYAVRNDLQEQINLDNLKKTAINYGLFVVPAAYIIDTYWYKEVSKNINNTAHEAVLIDFIENWELNKQYTPEKYHSFFNELTEAYQTEEGKALIIKNAGDIIETLQFIIQRTKLEVSEVFAKGAFGKEDTDIYGVKPSFKILKDFNPLADSTAIIQSFFGDDKK